MTNHASIEPNACCCKHLRTMTTMALGLIFVIGAGFLRYSDDSGLPEDIYRVQKINLKHAADLVILGDSRSYIGISPDDLAEAMPGSPRILNFGFNACTFYENYLETGYQVLAPDSSEPRIILCVTPRTLTIGQDDGFNYTRKMAMTMSWLERRFHRTFIFFKPMDPKELGYGIMPFLQKNRFYREFHANGWMAANRMPPKIGSGMREYRNNVFNDKQVDPEIIHTVLQATRNWTARGVRVYALRPPTHAAMVKLENELSGFHESDFRALFEEAGGVWLAVNQTAYITFDDSHLNRDSAVRFSRDLGAMIREYEMAQSPEKDSQD